MINKRLLIKNLLAHHDENSFYDKKRQLNLHTREGKAKFLKHICALSNANPNNNSYIVVGVEDGQNEVVGDDFFDDSRIQNLVNAFLENPPKIQYENIPFPNLPKDKVVGLVTIQPNKNISYFKKGIHTILSQSTFVRIGSNSVPVSMENVQISLETKSQNTETVSSIENISRNNIAHTLDGVMDFMVNRHKGMSVYYKVFKELFVVCWAGHKKQFRHKTLYSRVDIELVNEQIKLFYSSFDEVTIEFTEDYFKIIEYVQLGLNDKTSYYPLESVTINFFENGYYQIENQFLFEPPQFNIKMMHHIYNSQIILLRKLKNAQNLTPREQKELENLPATLMICYLNGFELAQNILIDAKPFFKSYSNSLVFNNFKETMRILRKVKYDKPSVAF
jgi:hypothetical protein